MKARAAEAYSRVGCYHTIRLQGSRYLLPARNELGSSWIHIRNAYRVTSVWKALSLRQNHYGCSSRRWLTDRVHEVQGTVLARVAWDCMNIVAT